MVWSCLTQRRSFLLGTVGLWKFMIHCLSDILICMKSQRIYMTAQRLLVRPLFKAHFRMGCIGRTIWSSAVWYGYYRVNKTMEALGCFRCLWDTAFLLEHGLPIRLVAWRRQISVRVDDSACGSAPSTERAAFRCYRLVSVSKKLMSSVFHFKYSAMFTGGSLRGTSAEVLKLTSLMAYCGVV